MVGEYALRLILQHLHRLHIAQAGGLGGEQCNGLHAAHFAAIGRYLTEATEDLLYGLHFHLGRLILQHALLDERRFQYGRQVQGNGPLSEIEQEKLLPGFLIGRVVKD